VLPITTPTFIRNTSKQYGFRTKKGKPNQHLLDETRIAQAVGFSRMTPLWFPTSASRHAPYFIATVSVTKITFGVN
jgi:hypothetical protein